ncbi:MAG TPA: hypothetical protein VGH33_23855 [Isosphaeraceae bacterium]|jgi:hypothetical protein
MRILHIVFAVFMLALALTVAREPVGRVALVVFVTLGAELACGTTAVMLLFQTIAAIGDARDVLEYAQGFLATAIVLFVASWLMLGMFSLCISVVTRVV